MDQNSKSSKIKRKYIAAYKTIISQGQYGIKSTLPQKCSRHAYCWDYIPFINPSEHDAPYIILFMIAMHTLL